MITDISLETALHTLVVAHMVPMLVLIAASAFGLAVIETVEEVGEQL